MIKQCILSLLCLLWAGQTLLAGELRERVYLQTDKQFYLSGELVWMKFIATDLDQRLSDVSKVGYVELLDSASAVVQARLVLEKGVGDGCLQLPSTLPTGNYRLVAYTRYMRNEGEEHLRDERDPADRYFIARLLFYEARGPGFRITGPYDL